MPSLISYPRVAGVWRDSMDAYDASQTDDSIRDGDVLVTLDPPAVAILVEAWPVIVAGERGEFHQLAEHATWETIDGGKYVTSAELALRVAAERGIT